MYSVRKSGEKLSHSNNNNNFKEDNIFGTNANLTYGPQLQDIIVLDVHGFGRYVR